jgi:hypothetical protein
MEHNISIDHQISLINSRIIYYSNRLDILNNEISLKISINDEIITINKIQAEINDINSIIEALQAELPSEDI